MDGKDGKDGKEEKGAKETETVKADVDVGQITQTGRLVTQN